MKKSGKRKVCSVFLVLSMIIGSMSVMAGCGKLSPNKEGTSKYITQAEWLELINEQFGMTSYQNTEPYFSGIDSSSEYYDTYQIAGEWEVIDENVQTAPAAEVTKEEAAITLVNAAGLTASEKVEIANEDKLKSPEKVEIAVFNHIFELKGKKFDYSAKIKRDEAEKIIQSAKDKWVNPEYAMVEEYEVKEDVVNLMSSDSQTIDYALGEDGRVYIPTENQELVKEGETYVLPANEEHRFAQVFKAESVEAVDGGIIISNSSEELRFEDVVQDLDVQNSFTPDFTNCEITDGAGNILTWRNNDVPEGTDVVNPKEYSVSSLGKMNEDTKAEKTGISDSSASFDFQINETLKVSGNVTSNKVEFTLTGEVNEIEVSKSYELENFGIDGKVDYKIFGGLKEARASYSYALTEKAAVSYGKGATDFIDYFNLDEKITDGSMAERLLSDCLSDLESASLGNYDCDGILIVSIPTPLTLGGVAGVTIDIRLGLSIEGKIEVTLTTRTTQGVEYKQGKGLRVINDKDTDSNMSIQAKAELYLYVGVVLEVLTINIIDVAAEVGIGAKYEGTLHLLDYSEGLSEGYLLAKQGTNLPFDAIEPILYKEQTVSYNIVPAYCSDVSVYFIFRITAGKNSLVGNIANQSWDICGENNGPYLYKKHWDNFKAVDECTLTYRTERVKREEETTKKEETTKSDETKQKDESIVSEVIDIDKYLLTISVGKKGMIEVTHLPEGYKESDLKWSSKDEKIAVVNSHGEVTGRNPGSTIIKVFTSDNKYSVECTVTVYEDNTIVFEPLE